MNVKISGEQLGFNPNSFLVLTSTVVLILKMLHHMLHLTGLYIVQKKKEAAAVHV